MLILKKPEANELTVIITIKAVCVSCHKEETACAHTVEIAAREFQKFGWRSYETDTETGANVCPDCVAELEQIEIEEQAA